MKLKIKHFSDISQLVYEKDSLRRKHTEHSDRQEVLRDFYNGQPIMPVEDAEEENLAEITNHLIGFSNMQIMETRLYSMWSTSNKLIDVDVATGDAIQRESWSSRINKYLNLAIYKTTRFGAFWRSVAGQIILSGRAACVHKEDSDWCPSVQPKLYLPDNIGTDASELTYAYAPRELTCAELEKLLEEAQTDVDDDDDDDDDAIGDTVEFNVPVIEDLIATIKDQIEKDDNQLSDASENEHPNPTNTDSVEKGNKTTANLWYYYEVRYDEDAESKVVDLLIFSDEFRKSDPESETDENRDTATALVAYYPAYYDHPSQWLHLIVADSTIGGDKRYSTAKGIAEITYNSDLDSEELLNRIFTGEKMRAVPRMQRGTETNEDELLGWNMEKELLVPSGLTEFGFKTGTGGLQNPLSLLRQNSASQSGAGHSNTGRGEELRAQAIERQGNTQASLNSRISDLHKCMEVIAHEMVRRFFVGEIEGGSPGYEEIMWFRKKMKEEGIDLELLAEQDYGFYRNMQVKIVKASTTGEVDQDVQVADRLMQNILNYPAAVRPLIIRRFTSLVTGDPDFADLLAELQPRIVGAQRVTAESEFEQIARDASIGEETPLGNEDVHQEHAATHNKHLRVILTRSALQDWTRKDAAEFAGMQLHQQKHLDQLLANEVTRAEGQQLLQEFQQYVAEGDRLLRDVTDAEQAAGGADKEQMEMQIKLREQERKEAETQIKAADTQSVIENREARQEGVARKGDQMFLIQKAQLQTKNNPQQQQS